MRRSRRPVNARPRDFALTRGDARRNKRPLGRSKVRQIEITVDVSDALGLGVAARLGASVVLPDPALVPDRPVVCFARPSSSYARGYYTHALPGPGQGAQAPWHAARGWIFVALDTLGCADEAAPDAEALTFAVLGAAADAAEREILLRLANGVLAPGFPPVNQPTVIGIGHSLGGALLICQQARHRSYDGIGVLGFSAIHSHPATAPGEPPVLVAWYPRDATLADSEPLNAEAMAAAEAEGSHDAAAWKSLAWGFHYDDVAPDIVALDLRHYGTVGTLAGGDDAPARAPWYAPRTPERAARATLTPGIVALEAAAITVPVLAAMGVRDLVPDPLGEPRAYRSARSIDLFVCPRMGHVHNFAGTRQLMWERIHAFGEWCAVVKAMA
ncbi:hypothetical protein [Novosphingobium album (ex Liu et al. 2023)]|uniref:Alpha/beta hydrolase n=1 Tax=Novosphingobium album (ex Liu et al. 2023) TaxID=3031130 RepID=A0ABT5WVR1_9SPHN|nr:hypothetical protein [Novosphingobium album (ex Liu et al. 2023)]MDE8653995.1 hypothetical protein [Novosphingobium album (ex Liu et al. 2023)]